jgi:hypothetical protein
MKAKSSPPITGGMSRWTRPAPSTVSAARAARRACSAWFTVGG